MDSYLHSGRVLVARTGPYIVGHLQLVNSGQPGQAELKNMAVREDQQGRGLGRRLMQAALTLLATEGVTTVEVATAAADIDNLRFYQRQGFRMRLIERDAFTDTASYPPDSEVAGIALRDRVLARPPARLRVIRRAPVVIVTNSSHHDDLNRNDRNLRPPTYTARGTRDRPSDRETDAEPATEEIAR